MVLLKWLQCVMMNDTLWFIVKSQVIWQSLLSIKRKQDQSIFSPNDKIIGTKN